MTFPCNKPSPVAQVWADADPQDGRSVWLHPEKGWPTHNRKEAIQWARETGQKPVHKWDLS